MAWTGEAIKKVWEKGTTVSGNDPNVYRKDQCGAWIYRKHHGNRDSQYGWEIDHITAEANGGKDDVSNLRPLQWQNNVYKQDNRLSIFVTADGEKNVVRK